jgi:hypothetical protein
MTIELTTEEKIAIVEQHLKNILFTEYNSHVSLIEANAAVSPNQDNINIINTQIANVEQQKIALQAKIDILTAQLVL